MARMKEFKIKFEVMRECYFTRLLKNNIELERLIERNAYLYTERLKIRDALYGGMCDVFQMYAKADLTPTPRGKLKIMWADVNSLYPTMMHDEVYCIKHPKIYRESGCEAFLDNNYELLLKTHGVCKCAIIYKNRNLSLTPLPFRDPESKKLMFPVCRTCSQLRRKTKCRCILRGITSFVIVIFIVLFILTVTIYFFSNRSCIDWNMAFIRYSCCYKRI